MEETGAGAYLHVPSHEGLRHPQHVRVLDQFQQVLPQLLLVLRDLSQLHLELLQLLLKQDGSSWSPSLGLTASRPGGALRRPDSVQLGQEACARF